MGKMRIKKSAGQIRRDMEKLKADVDEIAEDAYKNGFFNGRAAVRNQLMKLEKSFTLLIDKMPEANSVERVQWIVIRDFISRFLSPPAAAESAPAGESATP